MIDVRDGWVKCEIFNIDDVEFIINDLSINYSISKICTFIVFIINKMCK